MLNISKILPTIILSILLFASISCDSAKVEVPKPATTKGAETTETNDSGDKTKIKSIDGTLVAEISKDGQIEFGGKKLSKQQKNAEKVIFSLDGNAIAEVKTKDSDGFKVSDLSGKLLWKIKISADKIKISDNEENLNPFEIKKKDDGAKVMLNETKLGEVKYNPTTQKVKVKNAEDKDVFESRTNSQSNAYGVLLLDKIQEEQRFIILSELLSRNL